MARELKKVTKKAKTIKAAKTTKPAKSTKTKKVKKATKATKATKSMKATKTTKKELTAKDRKKVAGGKLPIPTLDPGAAGFSLLIDMRNKTKGKGKYDEELWEDGGPTIKPIIPPRPQR